MSRLPIARSIASLSRCKSTITHHLIRQHSTARWQSTLRTQNSLTASYYRGGTSRAVFFKETDLPSDPEQRSHIFRGVIGSPDPYGRQLDGMGGGISSLSKICVIGPPTHPDADVDYTFVAVGVKDAKVDYSSNCGNMSVAVGPYAVDTGIVSVPASAKTATVRVHNTNTGKIINSSFSVVDGEAAAAGDFAIDGVAGTAAPVKLDFVNPAGSRTGKLLPTGQLVDTFDGYQASCIDVGNPCVFVLASELGVDGELTSDQIENDADLKSKLESIRRQAGVAMGLAKDLGSVPLSVPKIAFASPRTNPSSSEVNVRTISIGQAHKAVPITVALAIAAAAKLPGSTISSCLQPEDSVNNVGLSICHPTGKLVVDATYDSAGELLVATVFSTARRLMEGKIFWK